MRYKGIPNKIASSVKSNIIGVFDKIGGRDAMAVWANENKSEFYRLYAKLMPTEVIATVDLRDASELSDAELLAIVLSSRERDAEPALLTQELSGVH